MITVEMMEYIESKGWKVVSENPPTVSFNLDLLVEDKIISGRNQIEELYKRLCEEEKEIETVKVVKKINN